MTTPKRLISFADLDVNPSHPERVSIRVRLELELADGRRVLLLNDRGWSSSATWSELTMEHILMNARDVVGPDEPPQGRSREEEANLHWASLQRTVQRHGVTVRADELRQLPHDVVVSERLLARVPKFK